MSELTVRNVIIDQNVGNDAFPNNQPIRNLIQRYQETLHLQSRSKEGVHIHQYRFDAVIIYTLRIQHLIPRNATYCNVSLVRVLSVINSDLEVFHRLTLINQSKLDDSQDLHTIQAARLNINRKLEVHEEIVTRREHELDERND